MVDAQEPLGRALIQLGLLTGEELEKLRKAQARSGLRLGAQIVDSAILPEERLVSELARLLGMDAIDPSRAPIHDSVKNLVPAAVAYRYRVVPIARRKEGGEDLLVVALSDPFDAEAARALDALVPEHVSVRCVLAGETEIAAALEQHYERPLEAESDPTLLPWVGPEQLISDAGPSPAPEAMRAAYTRREERLTAPPVPTVPAGPQPDELGTEIALPMRRGLFEEIALVWGSAPAKVKLGWAGAVVVLLVLSTAIFLPAERPSAPVEVAAVAPAAVRVRAPERGFEPEAPEDMLLLGKKLEIYPGVYDERAPSGSSYVSVNGAALRSTADERSDAIRWLSVGELVTRVKEVGGTVLVMVPPHGPAGFVDPGVLTEKKPIELLGREIGFEGCAVTKGKSIDECLYLGKDQQDECLVECRRHPSTRCESACHAAFEQCLEGCRTSEKRSQAPAARRRRR